MFLLPSVEYCIYFVLHFKDADGLIGDGLSEQLSSIFASDYVVGHLVRIFLLLQKS